MTLDSSDNPIRYEVSGGIAFIRMARPPVNALDLHMVRAVIAAFRQAADDDAVRTVVFASAVAKRFYAGLDIVGLVGKSPEQIRTLVHELCHLRVLDHSQRFWRLLERHRPHWRERRDWLRKHGPELLGYDAAA